MLQALTGVLKGYSHRVSFYQRDLGVFAMKDETKRKLYPNDWRWPRVTMCLLKLVVGDRKQWNFSGRLLFKYLTLPHHIARSSNLFVYSFILIFLLLMLCFFPFPLLFSRLYRCYGRSSLSFSLYNPYCLQYLKTASNKHHIM